MSTEAHLQLRAPRGVAKAAACTGMHTVRSANSGRDAARAARFAPALLSLLAALLAVVGFGCADLSEGIVPPPDPGSIVADGADVADNAPIAPSGVNVTPPVELAINYKPIFCCDPLTLDFSVDSGSIFGAKTTFEWDFGTAHVLRGPAIRHTFPWPGTYVVKLTAVLPDGARQTLEQEVAVGNPSEVPSGGTVSADADEVLDPSGILGPPPPGGVVVADAGEDREVVSGEHVVLDGTQSKSSMPRNLRYFWTQSGGPPVSLLSARAAASSFVAPDIEENTVQLTFDLTVTERDAVSSDSVRITVRPRPRPIVVANAGSDQTVPGGFIVQLDGSLSRTTSSRPMAYAWRQLAGPTVELGSPTEITTSFVAPPDAEEPITLLFELTVSQGALISKDDVRVTVQRLPTDDVSYEEKVLAWMTELDPLPKVHITWPMLRANMRAIDDELLFQYARVTHSLSINGEYADQEYMEKIVATCQRVNNTHPEMPCTLSVLLRPWMRLFPIDAPVTYRGPEHDAEIQFAADQLANTKKLLAEANQSLGASVKITCVFMDVERFFARGEGEPDAEEWNTALDEKYNVIYDVVKEALPDVRVEWYGRAISGLFTLREKGDSFSVPLYHVNERDTTRRVYWKAYREAVLHSVSEVTPWIALGTAYLRLPDGEKVWSFENVYDVSISWQLGAEINDPWYGDRANQFAPYHAATYVIFWPTAFDDRVPDWGRHFVAYVRGAHAITEIPR